MQQKNILNLFKPKVIKYVLSFRNFFQWLEMWYCLNFLEIWIFEFFPLNLCMTNINKRLFTLDPSLNTKLCNFEYTFFHWKYFSVFPINLQALQIWLLCNKGKSIFNCHSIGYFCMTWHKTIKVTFTHFHSVKKQ